MAELYLKGYICRDSENIIALSDRNPNEYEYSWERYGESIIDSIERFADEYGMTGRYSKGLGGRKAYIEDCNIRAYFTDTECELEEAMLTLDVLMYGGDIKTNVAWCGYSEWTITGLDLEEFSIGGHDLEWEFSSNYGRYCHLIIEC